MVPEQDYEIVRAMEMYGGSFVQGLAYLAHHADRDNYQILRTAFAKYFEEYRKFLKERS